VAWVRLISDEGSSAPRPLILGTLPELNEDEPNNELANANPVSGRAVVNGRLNKTGEVDCFAVSLSRGETLVASVQARRGLGSPMDGVLQIVNADGFVLAQNDDGHGIDPLLVYTAAADAKVFMRLFAFPEVPTSSINFAGGDDFVYRLTLSTGPVADGILPLALQAGKAATVRPIGWNIPPTLAEISVAAPEEGLTFSVGHTELANALELPLIRHASVVERAIDGGQPQPIELPVTISGRIAEANESDVYLFTAKKGDAYSFSAAAHELGYPLDPQILIQSAEGKEIAQNDDSERQTRDAELKFTAPADGQYRLVVRDLYRKGGPRHFYRLTAVRAAPDYSLSVAADSIVVASGKSVEIPVTVNRTNGYSGEIEISVTSLPEGVTAEAVKSAGKGASAKSVKLVLKCGDDASFSGTVRIVGVGAGDDKMRRVATAALASHGTAVEDVWLTVAAKK
jgi:hypothetical protein